MKSPLHADLTALLDLYSGNGKITRHNFCQVVRELRNEHRLPLPRAVEYVENEMAILKINCISSP